MLMKTLRISFSCESFSSVSHVILRNCFDNVSTAPVNIPSLVLRGLLEHTWGASVQRNKRTWVMLEKHVTLVVVLYFLRHVFDTVLYFCISFVYCAVEKRLLSLWQTFYSKRMTFTAVLVSTDRCILKMCWYNLSSTAIIVLNTFSKKYI